MVDYHGGLDDETNGTDKEMPSNTTSNVVLEIEHIGDCEEDSTNFFQTTWDSANQSRGCHQIVQV